MADPTPTPQITVLDAGGQYCHLIARKVRELGVYADIQPCDAPPSALAGRKGVIISGGPSSVYDPESPTVDARLFQTGTPVMGICYGLQLMAYALGGAVKPGQKGEYGLAYLDVLQPTGVLRGLSGREQIWMSHRDVVEAAPPGFHVNATTETCAVAAMAHPERGLYGVQFHPEVVHTSRGREVLSNFLFDICRCEKDWSPAGRVAAVEQQIRDVAGDRNVLFFVSGGVDSTVAYTLCLRALGPERVYGFYVDTGLMREKETEFVKRLFASIGASHFDVEDSAAEFLQALSGVVEPEKKRHLIGELFVTIQERILERGHFLDGHWILGQGTIYPDTIESGGSKKADLIKTHHNRVAGIQQLIAANRIIEPLHSFYKDEVREIGRELGLADEFLDRHPFPGPGLAIRCLCSAQPDKVEPLGPGWLVPISSVGVQGDSRTYRPVLAIDQVPDEIDPHEFSTALINEYAGVNRVILLVGSQAPIASLSVSEAHLTAERLATLRHADAIVRRFCHDSGFEKQVWQFPVVLIPLGAGDQKDSIVLRPIRSVDGMTANAVLMEPQQRDQLVDELLGVPGVGAVFFDLTHKPPGTIEWE